jgi:hypothetical protein
MRAFRAEGAAHAVALSLALVLASCGESFSARGRDAGLSDQRDASIPGTNDDGGAGSGGTSGSANGGTASGGTANGGTTGGGGMLAGGKGGTSVAGSGGESGSGGMRSTGGAGATPSGGTPGMDAGPDAPSREPVNIPTKGMVAWFRSDVGVTFGKGMLVSRWADQSPGRADATQDLTDNQPLYFQDGINGQPAVVFDGADDALQIAPPAGFPILSGSVTLFTVAQTNDPTLCTAMFETSNGSEVDDISLGTYQGNINFEIQEGVDENVPMKKNEPQLFSVVERTDDSYLIQRNGAFASSGSIPIPAAVPRQATFIGKTLYGNCVSFSGRIGEVIVYDRALEASEMATVNAYLQSKFGCCTTE